MSLAYSLHHVGVGARHSKCRIAMYSHDTMGLGHVRRNLLIAHELASSALKVEILLVTGSREAGAFKLPANSDCLTLPAVNKNSEGSYQSRHMPLPLNDLINLRSTTIRAALETFEPDIFIVDNVPRGLCRELDPVLEMLKENGRTRCVLGLRDILDEPEVVFHEWRCASNEEAIRDYYEAVWVYGDPVVYDIVREYRFPLSIASRVRYVGYLDQSRRQEPLRADQADALAGVTPSAGRLVVCVLGGGQDGVRLAGDFLETQMASDTSGVLVAGPLMAPDVKRQLYRQAGKQARMKVLDSVPDTCALIRRADRVITMGGYNTVGEVLSCQKKALIVPRVTPRREQLIRASRLRDLGLVDMLHPNDLSPEAIGRWLSAPSEPPVDGHRLVDMNGLARLPILVRELMSGTSSAAKNPQANREVHHAIG